MKYTVYTDGACNPIKQLMSSSFMIRTSNRFIGAGANAFDGKDITIAESLAIGLGVEYVLKNVPVKEEDVVSIRTDSKVACDFFNGIKRDENGNQINAGFEESFTNPNSKAPTRDVRVKLTWKTLQELNKKCKVEITHIKGHREEFNGNKVADRLAKYYLGLAGSK